MKDYFVNRAYLASIGIANAVLVTLGVGLLLQTIGKILDWSYLLQIGSISKLLLIPAIGVGIAICLKANPLVTICAAVCATIGGRSILLQPSGTFQIISGEPVGAILAVIIAVWIGKRISGKTGLDMILVPAVTLLAGGISGILFAKIMTPLLISISAGITHLVADAPILSSMIISLIFALLILSPASSAALAIALQLDHTASAAALIGCSVQFVTFAVLSKRDNNFGAFLAQLICTPKLQTPNIIKKPSLMLIPLLSAIILSPIGIEILNLEANNEIAGLGLCALVAPLFLLANQGWLVLGKFLFTVVILPAIIAMISEPILKKTGLLHPGDLTVRNE